MHFYKIKAAPSPRYLVIFGDVKIKEIDGQIKLILRSVFALDVLSAGIWFSIFDKVKSVALTYFSKKDNIVEMRPSDAKIFIIKQLFEGKYQGSGEQIWK